MNDYFSNCDEWTTGIASLDAQHTELAKCIREIENTCFNSTDRQPGHSPACKQSLASLLDNLYHATKQHFKFEESAMLEVQYPGHAAHSREHNLMLAELKLIARDHESGGNKVDAEMARGLKVWFIAHVKLSDCKFSAYIAAHRLALE